MDFLRRVFKSDSKPDLTASTGSNGSDGGLFGGLDVNENGTQPEDMPSGVSNPDTKESTSFTSEFSFMNAAPAQTTAPTGQSTHGSTSPTPSAQPPSKPQSSEKPKSSPQNGSPKSASGKPKGISPSPPAKEEIAAKSTGASPAPAKRPKKRTLENRPGYGIEESNSAQNAEAPNRDTAKTPEKATRKDSKPVTSPGDKTPTPSPTEKPKDTTSPASESRVNDPTQPQEKKRLGPESQETSLQALHAAYVQKIDDLKSKLQSLGVNMEAQFARTTATYAELGECEKRLSLLRADVKSAIDAERYEKAAELNGDVDTTQEQILTLRRRLEECDAEVAKLTVQKSKLLHECIGVQRLQFASLSSSKILQVDVINKLQEHIDSMETEASTVYASKVELLQERITDVQAELQRILEREQKVELKINQNSQGLSDTIKEDRATMKTLEDEIASLRAQLEAKEAALSTVQARVSSNEAKFDALRKEHGSYLDDIMEDKQKKSDLLSVLRGEKTTLDEQLLKQHTAIDQENAIHKHEQDVLAELEANVKDMERQIEASEESWKIFSHPLLPPSTATDNDVAQSSAKKALDSLVSKVANQKRTVADTETAIATSDAQRKRISSELDTLRASLPLLEQSKQVAVAAKDYKEAARLKTQIGSIQTQCEDLARQLDDATAQFTKSQAALIEQQAELTSLSSDLDIAQANNASYRMSELTDTLLRIKVALRDLHAAPPSEPSANGPLLGALHGSASTLSTTQLNGMLQRIRAEQSYLSVKYAIELPAEPDLPPSATAAAVEPTLDQPHPTSTAQPPSDDPSSPNNEPEALPGAPDEDGGLFDGLDEVAADPADEIDATLQSTPEIEVPAASEAAQAEQTKSDDSVAASIAALKQQISDIKPLLEAAEAAEDYERAEELHQQLISLQNELDSAS